MKLPLIPQDKANHAIYGAVLFYLFQFVLSSCVALLCVVAIAAAKEVYDYASKSGTPEFKDFVATIAGAIPLFLLKIL